MISEDVLFFDIETLPTLEVVLPEPVVEAVVEKPKSARPRVVPVFLLEDFPEIEPA